MNVLKAYANAGNLGQTTYSPPNYNRTSQAWSGKDKQSGDFLNISAEAMEKLEESQQNSISVMPQDTTYDQHGNVTRQLDSLQGDLRHLASQFLSDPAALGMLGHLGAIQSRLSSIRAQV